MATRYLFLFVLFLYSCSSLSEEDRFDKERSKVTHAALRNFKNAMQEKGFHAVGIGEGLDHSTGKQNHLSVIFDIDFLPDVDCARRLEVETLQDFLRFINSQEGIQNYVAEYPFPLKFVEISFVSKDRRNGVSSVWNCGNELIYDKKDPNNPISLPQDVHRESYEEAEKILDNQKNIKI
jgi:hypothetical protein